MIIYSTKLSTQAQVKSFYGGTTWISHSGYFLRGATSGVTANSASKTGGSDDAIVVKHTHATQGTGSGHSFSINNVASGNSVLNFASGTTVAYGTNLGSLLTSEVGSSGTNANIPNYKSVYIWERTAKKIIKL